MCCMVEVVKEGRCRNPYLSLSDTALTDIINSVENMYTFLAFVFKS